MPASRIPSPPRLFSFASAYLPLDLVWTPLFRARPRHSHIILHTQFYVIARAWCRAEGHRQVVRAAMYTPLPSACLPSLAPSHFNFILDPPLHHNPNSRHAKSMQNKTQTVRYWGPVPELGEGDWVGVELELPIGDTNGSYAGKTYFVAQPNRAIFVSPTIVTPYDEKMSSAAIIDDVKKRLQAKERERVQKTNADAWNKLDNHQEQLLLKRALVLENIFGTSTRRVNVDQMDPVELEEGYDGPHLTFPLTGDSLVELLEHFKKGKPLHIKYALDLLAQSRKIFAAEPTLQDIVVGDGHKLTLVGDLHGQLADLFTIFTLNGLPSEESEYLFNGDIVDRGQYGAEVLFTILALKCLFPRQVRVNRGNHECRQQNRLMGFEEEILNKYPGPNGRVLLAACQKVFDCMPLCALIHEKIFVVHGGLFSRDAVSLDHLRGISRKREPPVHSEVFEDRLYEEMLWSDPRANLAGKQLSTRGAGIEFGQDVTFEFLRTNQLALIVRSHECVSEGYDLVHNGRLMTLFSASRYCGLQTNKGAFLTMKNDLQPEIQQFYAHPLQDSHWTKPAEVGAREQAAMAHVLEEDMIKMIIVTLLNHKPSLYWYYTQVDKEKTGWASIEEWATGLKTVLELDLPFASLAGRLADVEEVPGEGGGEGGMGGGKGQRICYAKFLDRYRVEMTTAGAAATAWQEAVIDTVCEKLFLALRRGEKTTPTEGKDQKATLDSMGSSVKDAFSLFDVDQDGRIEYEEFISLLKSMDVGLSEAQIYELMRGMDKNKDSVIDLEEFTSRFGIVFTGYVDRENEGMIAGLSPADSKVLMKVGEKLVKQRQQLRYVYAEIMGKPPPSPSSSSSRRVSSVSRSVSVSKQGQGGVEGGEGEEEEAITYDQFRAFVRRLGLSPAKTSDEQLLRLAKHLDVDGNGSINFAEFSRGFKVADLRELRPKQRRASSMISLVKLPEEESTHLVRDRGFVSLEKQISEDVTGMEEAEAAAEEAEAGPGWTDRIIQQMSTFLFQYRLELASLYRAIDVNNDGVVSAEEFRGGFVKLNRVFNMMLTEEQIELLMQAIDQDGNGQITYNEFLKAFKVVDTRKDSSPASSRSSSPSESGSSSGGGS